ncbi:MAG: hypothetical protein ACTSQN_08040 [Candidatus Heimdallarchaeota archaeon]
MFFKSKTVIDYNLIFLFTGGLLGVGWAVDLIWLEKDLILAQ